MLGTWGSDRFELVNCHDVTRQEGAAPFQKRLGCLPLSDRQSSSSHSLCPCQRLPGGLRHRPGSVFPLHRRLPEPGAGGLDQRQCGSAEAQHPAAVEEPAGRGGRPPPEPLDRVQPAGHEGGGHFSGAPAERRGDRLPRPGQPQLDLLHLQEGIRPEEEPEGGHRRPAAAPAWPGRPGHRQVRHSPQRTPQDLRWVGGVWTLVISYSASVIRNFPLRMNKQFWVWFWLNIWFLMKFVYIYFCY